ncbi:MAG: glycosyltransferase family 2 protein [Burkholderiales bacterium]|nr:glycosyltransferase family 2 protein [Burkholderiales bacterium]
MDAPALTPLTSFAPPARRALDATLLTVVIPAFNEEAAIGETVRTIASWLSAHVPHWDILVVDDGSTDHTVEAVLNLSPSLHSSLLRLSRNFGKEAALTAGLDHARGGVVIGMDADGQHPVDLLGPMLKHWLEGVDMVYAVRQDRDQEPGFKRVGARWFYRALGMGGQIHIPEDAGDFRLMDRCVVDALKALPERSRFMKGLYAWVGFRTLGLPYTPLARQHGVTTYSKRKLIKLAWTGFTGFSALPLRVSSAVGLLLSALAFVYGVVVVIDNLFFQGSVPGWPTIVASIMFFSGVQLLFIGILGEYLARVFDEVKGRPTYLVADITPSSGTRHAVE